MDASLVSHLRRFLAEDVSRGDVTGSLLGAGKISAKIISREHATISGVSYAAKIFSIGGCRARALVREGDTVNSGVAILTVSGQVRHVLKCERTALNLVSRMSGIATMTKKMVSAMPAGGQGRLQAWQIPFFLSWLQSRSYEIQDSERFARISKHGAPDLKLLKLQPQNLPCHLRALEHGHGIHRLKIFLQHMIHQIWLHAHAI